MNYAPVSRYSRLPNRLHGCTVGSFLRLSKAFLTHVLQYRYVFYSAQAACPPFVRFLRLATHLEISFRTYFLVALCASVGLIDFRTHISFVNSMIREILAMLDLV